MTNEKLYDSVGFDCMFITATRSYNIGAGGLQPTTLVVHSCLEPALARLRKNRWNKGLWRVEPDGSIFCINTNTVGQLMNHFYPRKDKNAE